MTRRELEALAAPVERDLDRTDERRRKTLRHKGKSTRIRKTGGAK